MLETFDCAIWQEVDLFHNEVFDFPGHYWVWLFDDLFCLFCFVFQGCLVLFLQGSDEFLQFAILLVVVLNIAECSVDSALEQLSGIFWSRLISIVEFASTVIKAWSRSVWNLIYAKTVYLTVLFNPLLEILSFHHDVSQVSQIQAYDTYGLRSSGTKLYLLLCNTACCVQNTASFRKCIKWYLFISQLEIQVDLARCQYEDSVIYLILDDDLLTSLINFISEIDNKLLVGFHCQSSQIFNVKQLKFLPTSIFVLILNQILLHAIFNLWKNGDDLLENFFFYPANISIVFG